MSYVNSRSLLAAALVASISLFGPHTQIPSPIAPAPRRPGGRKKREKRLRARRKRFVARPAPAIKYAQLSPKIDGVRMRWEHGSLVPRDSQSALPLTQRQADRKRAKQLQLKAAQAKTQPKKKHVPRGTWFRGDWKGMMRAARRAGVISARQQRRIHRQERAEMRGDTATA